jgi:hypothetical protein
VSDSDSDGKSFEGTLPEKGLEADEDEILWEGTDIAPLVCCDGWGPEACAFRMAVPKISSLQIKTRVIGFKYNSFSVDACTTIRIPANFKRIAVRRITQDPPRVQN